MKLKIIRKCYPILGRGAEESWSLYVNDNLYKLDGKYSAARSKGELLHLFLKDIGFKIEEKNA